MELGLPGQLQAGASAAARLRAPEVGMCAAAYRARKGLAPGPTDMELGAARMKSATAPRAASPWWQDGAQKKGGLALGSGAGSLAFPPGERPGLPWVSTLHPTSVSPKYGGCQ